MIFRLFNVLLIASVFVLGAPYTHAAEADDTVVDTWWGMALKSEYGIGGSTFSGDDLESVDLFALMGATSAAISIDWAHIQIDSITRYERSGDGDVKTWGFGGHFGLRDETRGLIGLTFAYSEVDVDDVEPIDIFRIGGEAEYYFERFTVGFSGGHINLDTDEIDTEEVDAYYFKGLVRVYIHDDLKIEGSFAWFEPEGPGSSRYSLLSGEYKLPGREISLFTRWTGLYLHGEDADEDTQSHQFLAGFKYNLGASKHGTIKSNDRRYFTDSCALEGSALSIC